MPRFVRGGVLIERLAVPLACLESAFMMNNTVLSVATLQTEAARPECAALQAKLPSAMESMES